MDKLTSGQLQETQKVLELLAKNEIDNTMTNHSKLNNLLKVIKDVDKLRRKTWHDEKFGPSDTIVDETLNVLLNIDSDDIPF